MVCMIKSIYVRKGDEPFWSWAEQEADKARVPLSKWLADLLRTQKINRSTGELPDQTPTELVQNARITLDEVLAKLEET